MRPERFHSVGPKGRGVHRRIADAVRAAAPGDRVLVAPGRYAESVVLPRGVTLAAEHGAGSVLLSAPPGSGPALTVEGADCVVHGLVVEAAAPAEPAMSVAPGAGLVMTDCVVRGGRMEIRGTSDATPYPHETAAPTASPAPTTGPTLIGPAPTTPYETGLPGLSSYTHL
ncbi:hypothetical protein C1J01_46030, partial [Nonomuraea aridisoli]